MNKFQGFLKEYLEMGKGTEALAVSKEILQPEKQIQALVVVYNGYAKSGGKGGTEEGQVLQVSREVRGIQCFRYGIEFSPQST